MSLFGLLMANVNTTRKYQKRLYASIILMHHVVVRGTAGSYVASECGQSLQQDRNNENAKLEDLESQRAKVRHR